MQKFIVLFEGCCSKDSALKSVTGIYRQDSIQDNAFGKTEDGIKNCVLVNEIPEIYQKENQYVELLIDPKTKKFFWSTCDIPDSEEVESTTPVCQKPEQRIDRIEKYLKVITTALDEIILGQK